MQSCKVEIYVYVYFWLGKGTVTLRMSISTYPGWGGGGYDLYFMCETISTRTIVIGPSWHCPILSRKLVIVMISCGHVEESRETIGLEINSIVLATCLKLMSFSGC